MSGFKLPSLRGAKRCGNPFDANLWIATSRFALFAMTVSIVAAVPAHAERVGTAGAVNTRSVSTQPGSSEKVMEIGAQVVRNEKIETSASGSMQIMFIDKTSLTIGPNSKITIDEFVYNPADGTGTMSVRLGRGLLRVVGGQVTHTGGATITTPAATIGVRGGVATVNHCTGNCDQPGTRATLHFGSLTVTPIGPGGTPTGAPQTVTRPGFATFVAGQGQSGQPNNASAPQRATQSEISETNTALNSKTGQAGGATSRPTDQGAGNAGVGNVPSDAVNVASRQGQNASGGTVPNSTPANRTTQNAQQVAQQGTQGAASQVTASSQTVGSGSTVSTGSTTVINTKTLIGYSTALVTVPRFEVPGSDVVGTTGIAVITSAPEKRQVGATFYVASPGPFSKTNIFNFGSSPVLSVSGSPDPNGYYHLDQITGTPNPNAVSTRGRYTDDRRFGGLTEVDAATGTKTGGTAIYEYESTSPPVVVPYTSVRSFFVSSDAVGANSASFLTRRSSAPVKPCDCEYTRWGFWSATASSDIPFVGNFSTPISTWVAGVPARPVDLPTMGEATYVGHAIASISNGGNTYMATGNFRNTVNLGTYSGNVAVTGLDQTNYAGRVTYAPGSIAFGGVLTGDVGGRTAVMNGLFYQGATGTAAKYGEMGGSMAISGANAYSGSGIFAGKLTPGATPVTPTIPRL